jgi:phosphoesterase RecJ-like protein
MKAPVFFPAESRTLATAVEHLRGQRVAVLGHLRPDGDCIGSQVAMAGMLRNAGIEAICVNGDPIPRTLLTFSKTTPFSDPDDLPEGPWTGVTVDCADHDRIGKRAMERFPEIVLNVDHHISNTRYARNNIVVPGAAATAEILTGIAFDLDWPVDPVQAQALYLGIATDTGQFRFNSTTAQTFELCHLLCQAGADPAAAAVELYERERFGRINLLQTFLSSLRLLLDGRVCLGVIREEDFERTGTHSEDGEGFVDYARSIEGVKIGIFLEERSAGIKGSFRAKEPRFRVDQLAQQFNGGGHACAAGFRVNEPLEELEARLLVALETHLQALDHPSEEDATEKS